MADAGLITQIEPTEECPDGIGVYDDGNGWLRLVAYSQQGDGVFVFHDSMVGRLADTLTKIQHGAL